MSTHVKYNITCKVGSYEKNGETKGKYLTVGKVMEKDDGSRFIFIDPFFNFGAVERNGKDLVICSLMEPKDNNNQQQTVNQEEE
jgi:hypothetical protein